MKHQVYFKNGTLKMARLLLPLLFSDPDISLNILFMSFRAFCRQWAAIYWRVNVVYEAIQVEFFKRMAKSETTRISEKYFYFCFKPLLPRIRSLI